MNINKIGLFLLLITSPSLLLAARPSIVGLQVELNQLSAQVSNLEMEDDAVTTQLVVEKAIISTTATTTEISIDGVGINGMPTVTIGGITATVNAATQTSTHIDASIPSVLTSGTYLVTVTTGASRAEFDAVDVSISKTLLNSNVAYIKDIKPNGTNAGQCNAGLWNQRDLNTLSGDSSFVALLANQFTLQPGTYHISVDVPALVASQHKALLRNITTSFNELIGTTSYSSSSNPSQSVSLIEGIIILTEAQTFEVQHRCAVQNAAGFGIATNFGVNEVYTQVKITKAN